MVAEGIPAQQVVIDRTVPELATADLEFVVACIRLPGIIAATVASIYMPRGATTSARLALTHVIGILAARHGFLVILGDFNEHHPSWDNNRRTSAHGNALAKLFSDADLTCLNNGDPTYLSFPLLRKSTPDISLADQVTASEATWTVRQPVCNSDHSSILIKLWPTVPALTDGAGEIAWNIATGDWEAWASLTEWDEWTRSAWPQTANVDDVFRSWLCMFQRLALQHIGTHHCSPKPKPRKQWWDPSLSPLIRARDRVRKRLMSNPTNAKRREWQSLSKLVKVRIKEAKKNHLVALAGKLAQEPGAATKTFWNAFNAEFRPQPCQHLAVQRPDGSLIPIPQDKADAINEHFAGVSGSRVRHAERCAKCSPDPFVQTYLAENASDFFAGHDEHSDDDLTDDELAAALLHLRAHSAAGPDTVHPLFLKKGSASMRRSILRLCNFSWRTSQLPRLWKCATVRPISKGGSDFTPSGLRPISLTSTVGKLVERIVHARLSRRVEELSLLPNHQFGFRKLHGVMDCVAELTIAAQDAFERGNVLVAAFVDFAKAYDTVWRDALLVKLHQWGIRGLLLRWICDFLRDRVQRVRVEGALSSWRLVEDGVPQGSVLSCLLFVLFTSDIHASPPHAIAPLPGPACKQAYADDLAYYAEADSVPAAAALVQPLLS